MTLSRWHKWGLVILALPLAGAAFTAMWWDITNEEASEPVVRELPPAVREAEVAKVEAALVEQRAAAETLPTLWHAIQDNWRAMLSAVANFEGCDQAPIVLIEEKLIESCHAKAAAMVKLVEEHEALMQSVAHLAPKIQENPEQFDAAAVAWFKAVQTDVFREYLQSFRTFLQTYQAMLVTIDNEIIYESISEMTPERRAELLRHMDRFNEAHTAFTKAGEILLANMQRVQLILPQ